MVKTRFLKMNGSYNTNSIPSSLNDLLVKLKILSMVERGKKINMSNMSFVDASSWTGAFMRSLSGEGRKSTMAHINQIVTQAIKAIEDYRETEFIPLIVNALDRAKIGIMNLGVTYQTDPSIVSQITICVDNINIQLHKNKHVLEGHRNSQ